MPEVVSNTFPLQYLHQLGLLDLLPRLVGRFTVPQAVVEGDAVVILDDARVHEAASRLGLKFTGILGVLLDAKSAGLIPAVEPRLDRLDALGFRLAGHTRSVVLRLAGE